MHPENRGLGAWLHIEQIANFLAASNPHNKPVSEALRDSAPGDHEKNASK